MVTNQLTEFVFICKYCDLCRIHWDHRGRVILILHALINDLNPVIDFHQLSAVLSDDHVTWMNY